MVRAYDWIDSIQALDHALKVMFQGLPELEIQEVEYKAKPVRLFPTTFDVAARMNRCSAVVTAHDLSQYVNRFYSIELKEAETSWFDLLIDWDEIQAFGGLI